MESHTGSSTAGAPGRHLNLGACGPGHELRNGIRAPRRCDPGPTGTERKEASTTRLGAPPDRVAGNYRAECAGSVLPWADAEPRHGAPEWRPTRGIQWRVRRSGATLDRRRCEKLGRASRATELLNRNRPGKFNGGLAGPVRSWARCRHRKLGGCEPGWGVSSDDYRQSSNYVCSTIGRPSPCA